MSSNARPYGRFAEETSRRGIRRTLSYQLRDAGLLDVFHIGRAAFVFIDSIDALPDRLKDPAARAALEAVQHPAAHAPRRRATTRRGAA